MKADQIQKIIEQENERAEAQVAEQARQLIRYIIAEQTKIKTAVAAMAEFRAKLTALTVETIDTASVIG